MLAIAEDTTSGMLQVFDGPWSAEDVLMRFLEAADTDNRMPPVMGPKRVKSMSLEVSRDSEFEANVHESMRNKKEWFSDYKDRTKPMMGAITRMEEVLDWSVRWLDENHARALWLFCFARVKGDPAYTWWEKRGIKNRTGYNRLSRAIAEIVKRLNGNSEFRVTADLDRLASIGIIPHESTSGSIPVSPRSWHHPDKSTAGIAFRYCITPPVRRPKRKKKARRRGGPKS